MPGLGARLRARWRALVDAARPHPRRADESGDPTAGSQHADTGVVDLRPRVRMPGPDAGAEGPPPEWLAYVMAQDPVWTEGGLGLSGRPFDIPVDDVADPGDVSTLTSSPGTRPADPAPAEERPVAAPPARRRPRARFVRPSQPRGHGSTEPTPIPKPVAYPAARTDAPTPAFPTPAHSATPARPPRRLLPRHAPAASDPAAPGVPAPAGEHVIRAPHFPDPPGTAVRGDDPPVWPVAASTTALRPTSAPVATPHAASAPAVLVRADRTMLTAPPQRTVPPHLTSTPPAHAGSRAGLSPAGTYLRPVVDPWASASSSAPIVELRRDLDDRPAPADPPVAVRWRALDVDRLGIEQRAL